MIGAIVGIPTINEFSRLSRLGESFFNPNINLIPLSDGLSLSFILNIFLFIPLGFLSPMISRTYQKFEKVLLLDLGLSLTIELSQLFTLYRATDINDLITNILGTWIGYLCYRFVVKLKIVTLCSENHESYGAGFSRFLPVIILAFVFVFTFIS